MPKIAHRPASARFAAPALGGRLDDPHSLALAAVAPGSRVLDAGCGGGEVAAELARRGCRVFAVEIDPARAEAARADCERVVVGDVETIDWDAELPGLRFDAILFLDVLEHLRDPSRALARVRRLLEPGGRVVASIPNVTHAAVRLDLLRGRFRYREEGLLDRGHLRFFDAEAVDELFSDAGYRVVERARILRGIGETEIPVDRATAPPQVVEALEDDLEAMTYQFFVVAAQRADGDRAAPAAPEEGLVEAHREEIRGLAGRIREGEAYARHLEEELARKAEHAARLEAEIRDGAHAAEARAAAERESAAYVRKLEDELARKGEHAVRLEAEVRAAADLRARLDREIDAHREAAVHAAKLEAELARGEERVRAAEADAAARAARAEAERAERLAEVDLAREERAALERELLVRDEWLAELRGDVARADERERALVAELEASRLAAVAAANYLDAARTAAGTLAAELETVRATAGTLAAELEAARTAAAALEGEVAAERQAARELAAALAVENEAASRLSALAAEVEVARQRLGWLEDLAQQPRHAVAERANAWMKSRTPHLHALLRPLIVAAARRRG